MARTRTNIKLLAAIQPRCVTLIFLCYLISTINAQPKIPSKAPLYVFGDSLYDTGTALYVNHGPAANSKPYGMTYFKKPSGRFSDGLLIPDFIAQFAGLPLPEPYSNPNLKDYTKSVNFADAAAGVLVETRPNTLNLKLQTQSFVEMTQKLTQQYGQAQTQTLLSKAVLLFNIGTNDYIDIYNKNKRPLSAALTTQTRQNVIGNFSIHLTTMYNQGARNFAFQGSAPVGCLPAYREADGSCSQELNSLARMHNFRLKALCKSLVAQLPGSSTPITISIPPCPLGSTTVLPMGSQRPKQHVVEVEDLTEYSAAVTIRKNSQFVQIQTRTCFLIPHIQHRRLTKNLLKSFGPAPTTL